MASYEEFIHLFRFSNKLMRLLSETVTENAKEMYAEFLESSLKKTDPVYENGKAKRIA